jgi:thymidylate kinase
MVYIIEGIDNSGKSTQVKLLQKELSKMGKYPIIIHCSSLDKSLSFSDNKNYYIKLISKIKELNKDFDIIMDRSHLGEAIYGPLYRNYSGDYVLNLLSDFSDVKLVLFTDEIQNVIQRDDGDSFSINKNKKEKELQYFRNMLNLVQIKNKKEIKITGKSINEVQREVNTFLFGENYV